MAIEMDSEDILALSLAYGFFRQVYYTPPGQEFISGLVGERFFTDWLLPEGDVWTEAGLRCLADFRAAWNEERIQEDDLRSDYTRLFGGEHPGLASPYESAYLRMDDSSKEKLPASETFKRFGLLVPDLEAPDHIGLAFAFLAHLNFLALGALEDEAEGEESALGAQHAFLAEHVLPWAPSFLQLVVEHAETDYYRGSAWLTMGCLRQHAAWLRLPVPVFVEPG